MGAQQLYCLNCGLVDVSKLPNNSPVADFSCAVCSEEYELKSQARKIGSRVPDGAHKTMLERLAASNNPSLILLAYHREERRVLDLIVVPKHFFTAQIIEKRTPLAPTAKRAGWIGCNILLSQVPETGKIAVIRGGVLRPKSDVLEQWRRTCFLRDENVAARGWLIEVMRCVEALGKRQFELAEVYAFEERLKGLYPDNRHIREKMRQQLQRLRDAGFVEFLGNGRYRRSG
ncbi:MAG: DpnI domain-containing protein [Hyphomonadaceae bacterium]